MEHDDLSSLLSYTEAEWIEFKHNNSDPDGIGQDISALSNAARLHHREVAYIIWGIEDGSRRVLGTQFRPRRTKVKGQELENWLATQLDPRIDFKIYELEHQDRPVVVFAIQPSPDRPVSFRGIEYVRVGSYTKKLRDHPEKERALWARHSQVPFEREIALRNVRTQQVLGLLDHGSYFELTNQATPTSKTEILKRLSVRSSSFVVETKNGTLRIWERYCLHGVFPISIPLLAKRSG